MFVVKENVLRKFIELKNTKEEKGGFVIGKLRSVNVVFFDFIECRNISSCPMVSYSPSIQCQLGACILKEFIGNSIITLFHTHTNDTLFSEEDLISLERINKAYNCIEAPSFLVTPKHFIVFGFKKCKVKLCNFAITLEKMNEDLHFEYFRGIEKDIFFKILDLEILCTMI